MKLNKPRRGYEIPVLLVVEFASFTEYWGSVYHPWLSEVTDVA
jgi:hypothetical protein